MMRSSQLKFSVRCGRASVGLAKEPSRLREAPKPKSSGFAANPLNCYSTRTRKPGETPSARTPSARTPVVDQRRFQAPADQLTASERSNQSLLERDATHNSHTTVEIRRREAAIPARVARGWAVAIAIRHAAVTDPPENMKGTCVHAFAAKIKPMITGMTSSPEQATRQVLDALIADGDTPGLQYVFVSADEALLAHHGGLANPGAHLPINDRTTFNAYSVTKTFTAAAVLQLVEQGRIELDRPIAQYCDRWPQSGAATVRQTLLHTAGFANPNPLPWVHLIDERAVFDRVRFVEDLMRTQGRPISKPGERYAYSNIGYLLLAS
jgi:hypothetical protein